MSDKSRISGHKVELDYHATRSFFEFRGQQQYPNQLSATMYSDHDPQFVEERDRAEKAVFARWVNLNLAKSALELGCGLGRWAIQVMRVKNRFKDWVGAIRMHINDLDAAALAGDELRREVMKHWLLEGENLEQWRAAWLPS